jgi:HD-GYP domain-containing protein (c-di-GMP phosphodiesterase class II)
MFALHKLKFQHWIVGSAAALVLVLTGVYLFTVFGKFQTTAEGNALEKFELIAQRASDNLLHLLDAQGRRVVSMAGADLPGLLASGSVSRTDVLAVLRDSVTQSPEIYGEFYGLPNGDFLQAVAVRNDPLIVKALNAPEGTQVATRQTRLGSDGQRTESWRFYNSRNELLGERSGPTTYDPTQRPWYQGAQKVDGAYTSEPYLFSSTQRGGLTLAAKTPSGQGVLGFDIQLDTLGHFLESLDTSPNAYVAILDRQNRLVAAHGRGNAAAANALATLSPVAEAGDDRVAALPTLLAGIGEQKARLVTLQNEPYVLAHATLRTGAGASYEVLSWAPVADFTGLVDLARRDILAITALILLVLIPLALLGTRSISRTLGSMAQDSERLRNLDFSAEPHQVNSFLYEIDTLAQAQSVMFRSVKQRAAELELAQAKLSRLVETGIELGRETDRDKILKQALFGARDIAHCQAATLYLKTERQTLRFALRTSEDPLPSFELPLYDEAGQPIHRYVATHTALSGETVVIDDIYTEDRFDLSGTKKFSEESGMRVVSMLCVPLKPGEGKVIGLIQMMNALDPVTGEAIPFDADIVSFVDALAAQAAVAIENRNLLEAQQALMDSMIQIIAGAIDTKSPYTGGHCERVPELAIMLAEKACEVKEGPLGDFEFRTPDEWREFRIGAWLHDCGKVTTPEYVVDKATKLETIFNRIHEVRMRFEVLLRDAMIERLQAVHERGLDPAAADATFDARKAQLIDDYAFVAECNLGGEFMAPDKVERLKQIAQNLWVRHFDDRLGLSHEELKRYEREPVQPLPVQEALLSDKAHHIFERPPTKALDDKYGFRLKVPEHLYNHGEVYNLSIGRGTLTEEERFKINEHIIQTIVMLENMPLPPNLKRVPEYAGTHHETLIGSGYPRKLQAQDLSVPSRIMAIADIFEALTASDRPYKKAKTLSECIKILSFFKKDQHIDPVLFDLFLTSGVYKTYAEKYLLPEQIDEVDVAKFVG